MSDADNLDIKKRARRRLVGAAALALLAAIVLPMMMEEEPRAPSQDIQVTIPDRDGAASTPPNAGRAPEEEPQPVSPPQEEAPGQTATPSPPSRPPSPPPAAAGTTTPPPQTTPAPPKPPVATPTPPAVTPPAAIPEHDREAARAQRILDGAQAPAAPSSGAFVLQIGAFGDPAKAAAISNELKKKGFAAYTEKVNTVVRVRIGPFGSREEAEKAAVRLKAQGHSSAIVPR